MEKITLIIEGMSCGMCEAHIRDAIRRAVPDAKKVSAKRAASEASFLTGSPVEETKLREAIEQTGYRYAGMRVEPLEKKRWF